MIYEYMNYNAESDFFCISRCKVATSDRWGGQIGKIFMSIFYDLTYRKLSNSVVFDRVIQKIKRWTFWGHRVYRDLINVHCVPKSEPPKYFATATANLHRFKWHSTHTSWWRGSVVERRSLAGELSLSCARPAADGWPLMWVSHPLQVSQLGQLSLLSFRGR